MRLSPLLFGLFAVMVASGTAAKAEPTARTPLTAPLEMTGRTGGDENSSCGNINPSSGQVVQVTEPFASLRFEVESEGDYTLLITGPDGFQECVFAHNYDGGVIRAPGLLNQGEYQVHVGDRRGESHPYIMKISQ